jgi:hypothetical protein
LPRMANSLNSFNITSPPVKSVWELDFYCGGNLPLFYWLNSDLLVISI